MKNNSINQRRSHTRIGITLACVCVLLFQGGCMDLKGALSQASAWRTNASDVERELQTQLDTLNAKSQTIPADSPDRPTIDALIETTRAKIQTMHALIAQADQVINEATNPSDSLTRAANALSPWVPLPAQGPLVLGAALIASMVRSKNLKNSATSIIRSIDHTMSRDPAFKDLFNAHADTIRTIQTPSARKFIDSTVKKSSPRAATI